ncbi:hypothetical protein AYI69_g6165, partial [Smittium culicis]
QLLNNSSKEYWRYIKSCTGNTLHSVSNGPVYDLDKNLITENENKLEIWNQHFSDLAKDTTGNSRDPSKWQALLSDDSDYFPECDYSISWADITAALDDTPNNKATGADGVPSEIWKLGNIPKTMTTSVVVPVPKKGDMKDPNNYRGISLIPTLIKLLAKILATKLAAIDKKYKILVKEQTGFRNFEKRRSSWTTQPNTRTAVCRLCSRANRLCSRANRLCSRANRLHRIPQTSLNSITVWSDTWEMAVNASKSAIISVNYEDPAELTLQWQTINTTDQYTYLGYIMNPKWSVAGTIKNNKLKAQKAMYAGQPGWLPRSEKSPPWSGSARIWASAQCSVAPAPPVSMHSPRAGVQNMVRRPDQAAYQGEEILLGDWVLQADQEILRQKRRRVDCDFIGQQECEKQ